MLLEFTRIRPEMGREGGCLSLAIPLETVKVETCKPFSVLSLWSAALCRVLIYLRSTGMMVPLLLSPGVGHELNSVIGSVHYEHMGSNYLTQDIFIFN